MGRTRNKLLFFFTNQKWVTSVQGIKTGCTQKRVERRSTAFCSGKKITPPKKENNPKKPFWVGAHAARELIDYLV